MDAIILRIPVIAQQIFEELDNQCLTKCKYVNQNWNTFIKVSKPIWIRILNKYIVKSFESRFQNHWKLLIKKESVHNLRKITTAVYRFYLKNSSRKEYQWSPHHIAADYGNVRLYKHIIKKIGFENLTNNNDVTPLHIAVQYGHVDICKLIIENTKSDINPRKINGWTPLHIAAKKGHFEICKLIIGQVEDKNPAIPKGDYNERSFGGTPLHFAVLGNFFEICKLIVENATEKNPPDNTGCTPLHYAAMCSRINICKLIIENVKDKNPRDHGGKTPLHLAAMEGHFKTCKFIIKNVDDINPQDNLARTPFQLSATKKVANLLYNSGGTDGDGGVASLSKFEMNWNERNSKHCKIVEKHPSKSQ